MLLALPLPPTSGKWRRTQAGLGAGRWRSVVAIASAVAYFVPNPLFPRRQSTLPLIVLGTSLLLIANIDVEPRRSSITRATHPSYAREVFRRAMRKFHCAGVRAIRQRDRAEQGSGAAVQLRDAAVGDRGGRSSLGVVQLGAAPAAGQARGTRDRSRVLMRVHARDDLRCSRCASRRGRCGMSLNASQRLQRVHQRHPASTASRDTLRHYVERMPNLKWYGQHYPPGNLVLLTIEKQLGIPGLTKSIVCLLTVLTVVPLYMLARELELDDVATSPRCCSSPMTTGVLDPLHDQHDVDGDVPGDDVPVDARSRAADRIDRARRCCSGCLSRSTRSSVSPRRSSAC